MSDSPKETVAKTTTVTERGGRPPADGERTPAFYRKLVENAADLISVIDANAVFLYKSPGMQRMFGVAPEEMLRLEEERFHPDDYKIVMREFMQLVQNGGSLQLTNHRLRHADGSWRWVQTHCTNMLDDPDIRGVLMVSRDVTEQRRREDEIRQAEISARFGHWRWDNGRPVPEWSDGMYALLGYSPDDVPHPVKWHMDLVHPADRDRMMAGMLEALTSGKALSLTASLRHADGSYRRILSRARVEISDDGQHTSLIGICQDVTELEKTAAALKRSEDEFRILAENTTDKITRYSLDGQVEYVSPSVEAMLGYTPEEIIGFYAEDMIHPLDNARLRKHVLEMYDTLTTVRVAFRMRQKSGAYVWLETTMSPLVKPGTTKPVGFVACARDVSDQKRYEQELMAARERAEAANLTKTRFLANMSHELRTPLNAILGFSELMTEKTFGPLGSERYEEYTKLIHESGQHLLALINDILDMSKIEAGKYDLQLEDVDMTDPIEKAIRMVETRVKEGSLTLNVDIDAVSGETAHADSRAVMQAILNLLSNAVKFTPAGGEISIRAAAVGSEVEVVVSDTGVGIDPRDLDRVQRPFEQVVRHAELASQGTGLGLPLVRALVEIQNGTFDLQSARGEGTTARIRLPRGRSMAAIAATAALSGAASS